MEHAIMDEDLNQIMRLAKRAKYRFLQRNLLLDVEIRILPQIVLNLDDTLHEDEDLIKGIANV